MSNGGCALLPPARSATSALRAAAVSRQCNAGPGRAGPAVFPIMGSERRGGFFNPSLDDMNKEILGWDVYTMLSGEAMYELKKVPVHFSSVDQYLDVFEPLLLEESRAQTLRSLQSQDVTEHQLKLQAVRGEPHEPFRIANFEAPPEATTKPLYFDTDLVLVSHEQLDLERVDDEGQLVPQQFHALALVNGSSPGTLALKLYLPEEGTSRLPSVHLKRLAVLRKVMVPSSGSWWIRKLGNMVTINREFQVRARARARARARVRVS